MVPRVLGLSESRGESKVKYFCFCTTMYSEVFVLICVVLWSSRSLTESKVLFCGQDRQKLIKIGESNQVCPSLSASHY